MKSQELNPLSHPAFKIFMGKLTSERDKKPCRYHGEQHSSRQHTQCKDPDRSIPDTFEEEQGARVAEAEQAKSREVGDELREPIGEGILQGLGGPYKDLAFTVYEIRSQRKALSGGAASSNFSFERIILNAMFGGRGVAAGRTVRRLLCRPGKS